MVPEGGAFRQSHRLREPALRGILQAGPAGFLPGTWTRFYDTFPRLASRRSATPLRPSAGEQQMLAVGRASMSRPRPLLRTNPR